MPLVLTQNEKSAAALAYDDRLGKIYEFPTKYQKLIMPGESFIYYRGKRSANGTQVPHYFGRGIIGAVTPATNGRLRCAIDNYRAFDEVVPFKHGGRYSEPGANGRTSREVGLHFRTGVRAIDQDVFNAIVAAGLRRPGTEKAASKWAGKTSNTEPKKHAVYKVHQVAVALATFEAKTQWPSAKIFRAPAGQHFALIVKQQNGVAHHIAVKATEDHEPRARLSTGEVQYSESHAAAYSLWVFYAVDVQTGTGKLIKRKGRITEDDIDLQAALDGGRLLNTRAGKQVGPIPG